MLAAVFQAMMNPMPRILLLPPVVVALYLLVISWTSLYVKPDIIVIPGVQETVVLVIGFVLSTIVYWLVILPAAYIIIKFSALVYCWACCSPWR